MDSPTVLYVDDRPNVLKLRKATLESHGYSVKIASSVYAAIKILEGTSVAVVLLEYKQEGMDAEAVACHIKQRFPNLPIILLSADDFACLEKNRRLSSSGKPIGLLKGDPSGLAWMQWVQFERKKLGRIMRTVQCVLRRKTGASRVREALAQCRAESGDQEPQPGTDYEKIQDLRRPPNSSETPGAARG
jgi:CheY-like chemotaxis protein